MCIRDSSSSDNALGSSVVALVVADLALALLLGLSCLSSIPSTFSTFRFCAGCGVSDIACGKIGLGGETYVADARVFCGCGAIACDDDEEDCEVLCCVETNVFKSFLS